MQARTLAQHLLLWILPFITVVLGLSSVSTYLIARTVVLDEVQQGARSQSQTAAAHVQGAWERARSDLLTLAESPLFADYFANRDFRLDQEAEVYRKEIERMLQGFSSRSPAYPRLRFLGVDGREICAVQDGAPRPPSRTAEPAAAPSSGSRPGRSTASRLHREAWHAWPVVTWTTGIYDRQRRLRGTLAIDASLGPIYNMLDGMRIGESGRVRLLERGHGGEAPFERTIPMGRLMAAAAPVPGTPLYTLFTVDRVEFLQPLWLITAASIVLALGALTLLVLGLRRQLDILLRPIQDLAEAARAVASGRQLAEVPAQGTYELAQLARSFNAMMSGLRQRTEELVASEARHRLAIENSPHAVVSLDQNMLITLWNRRAEGLFGYQPTEAFGRPLSFLLDQKDFRRLKRVVEIEGAVRHAEARGKARDGRLLDLSISWTGQVSSRGAREWFVAIQDETETKRLQSQLIQAEKLSAVGSLIAGVAHELNNPLSAVVGYAEMLREKPVIGATTEEREDLRLVHANALRCKDIVQGLLSFVRQGSTLRQRLSLNHLAQATIGLFEYRLVKAETISLEVDLDRAGPLVAGDFSRIQQIVVNLLTNASDALSGRLGRRVVRVSTRALPDGSELVVEDSGPGVPPDLLPRLFQPFVTGKPAGSGTGLGLSISAQTAQEFGASLRHEPAPGGGARFVLRFPPCPAGLQEADSALNLPPPCPGALVLVIDDEPDLAQLVGRILAEDGMEPVVVADPAAGLRALAGSSFDLVVCDLDMGATNGFALHDQARRAGAPTAFLFVTGDVLNQSLQREAADREAPLLAKPFLRTDLLRAARRAAGPSRTGRRR